MEEKHKNDKLNTSHREVGLKSDKTLIHTSKVEIMDKDRIIYGENPERWYNLVAYCFCLFACGFQWLCFSSFSKEMAIHYEISLWKVNILSVIYFIIYPFVCIPEAWIIETYTIKKGFILSSGCILAGSFFKIFTNYDKSLSVAYIGQILSGLFRPLLLNSPGKIASNWFKEDYRTIICSICCLSDIAGIMVGYLLGLGFFKDNLTNEEFRDQMFKYTISEFLICFILCIPAFFIDKFKPDKPSSPSQNKYNLKKFTLMEHLKSLFKNCRFISLSISTFFILGYFYIMGTTFNNLMNIYGITKDQCTIIYSVSITVGLFSSLIISFFIDKTKKFKLFIMILVFLGIIFQVFLTFLLEIGQSKGFNTFGISLPFYILINAVIIPFYTVVMNYACEITYPVPESLNGSIMMAMANICGICGTYLFDHFINNYKNKPWISNVILLIFLVIAAIFIIIFDEKLMRNEIDKEGRLKEKEKESNKIEIESNKIEIENNQREKEGNQLEIESNRIEPVNVEVKQK